VSRLLSDAVFDPTCVFNLMPYAPECVEGLFSEVRRAGVLRSWASLRYYAAADSVTPS